MQPKKLANDSSFWKYKVYADTRRGSCWRGPQMRVGMSTTAILAIWLATSSETTDIRPAVLYDDYVTPLLACDWLQNEWPRM